MQQTESPAELAANGDKDTGQPSPAAAALKDSPVPKTLEYLHGFGESLLQECMRAYCAVS